MSTTIIPYLFFDGSCREVMSFYKKVLGGELTVMTYGDSPNCPKGAAEKVMHASLKNGSLEIAASDTPDEPPTVGDNIQLTLNLTDVAETERIFKALSEGGSVFTPLQDMFWGARFGMLTDRYGINWMLNCALKKS